MHVGLRGWIAESRDRILASDPGLGRLRLAGSAAIAMGTTLGVEYLLATLTHAGAQGTLVAMLLGAVVAMMGSNALVGPEVWSKVKTAFGFPFAVGIGLAIGSLVGGNIDLMLAVFVAVMFVAVFVRRFGIPFFFYGFMAWMGYFFSSFLHTSPGMVPHLLVSVVVSALWVLLLSVTVLRTNRRRVLRSTLLAFRGRARAVVRDSHALLEACGGDEKRLARARRRLGARQAGLVEAALMAEAWSDDRRSLPPGWTAPSLRRRLLDVQQTVDRLGWAATSLAGGNPSLVAAAAEVMDHLAHERDEAARDAAERLGRMSEVAEEREVEDGRVAARHLAVAALTLVELRDRADEPPEVADLEGDFEATTPLMMGYLPGSPAVAREVPPRAFRWNPLRHVDMPTRQAFQVALSGTLAIVLGRMVSPNRYYWAVIAAFVMFTGTGTRAETFLKGFNRVLGTMVGLVAAIFVAHLTQGHSMWVLATILLCVF
ncbi:MAG: FUSC family protein, partial [Nocardioidaceae bacterium]